MTDRQAFTTTDIDRTMIKFRHLLVPLALLVPGAVWASPATDALGKCLSDNTTGKDRKDLATWIFVAMSSHPELISIAKAGPAEVENAQRTMGALVTRLLADACPNETKVVIQAEGSTGLGTAFEQLGRMAMQELMTNRQVASNISGFERYLDKARLDRAMGPR